MQTFGDQRERYSYLMENRSEIDAALAAGAEKAKKVAREVLQRVRSKSGY